ncbi:hypothetical protein GJAV_G00038030 [Gymnothorax javanicus]|nr:hypothetical protein GJAV_G00038030 [Gymnothorax javanicus]
MIPVKCRPELQPHGLQRQPAQSQPLPAHWLGEECQVQMSLADQQWYPTSVKVTVFQARNLKIKGKHGTNDAYAVMQVAKEKFSTAVAEKTVTPVWKEEASFDLPLFHHGNEERCTLHVMVMHRTLMGIDKQLGQAVINLLELNENKNRNKTEWFKLLNKHGKEDKERGEVLLDIQFMRNNMTASMFDLSGEGKSRSRMGKLKDKLRGKKSGHSDSASAIVPSSSYTMGSSSVQVMTDSEEDGEDDAGDADDKKKKKKSKIKALFGSKGSLQRNISQSMVTLGSLPEKNSTLSGSRSSGLSVDSTEGKKKFKFLTHKRTDSSDSRGSLGTPFSLGRSKQGAAEPSGVCINGSHVYVDSPVGGSTLSLNSSDLGSAEDLHAGLERSGLHGQEEDEEETTQKQEMRRLEEEREKKQLEEEDERKREEEQEMRRREEEVRRREEEEEMRRREEEMEIRKREEEELRRRREEEEMRRRAEEEMRKMKEEEEERRREEEEMRRRQEVEMRLRAEEEEMRRRQEEEMRVRAEEEEMRRRAEEEIMRKKELEEERKREEETRRKKAEEMRLREEEEEMRRREEEEIRLRKEQEQDRRREEEEMRRAEEEMRKMKEEEEERRREEEEMRRRQDEEMRVRAEEEEMRRREEEEIRLREEEEIRRRAEEEMRRRKEEEERREEEEIRRRKEEEMRLREEEEMRVREEEMRREEERKREEEEMRKMKEEEEERRGEEEEMRRRKEEEMRLREEEEIRRREEEEVRVREEEMRREEERKREEEEMRKMKEEEEERRREEEEMRRIKEEVKRKKEEEEIRRREEEEEMRKQKEEEEMRKREEEEEMRRLREEEQRREEEEISRWQEEQELKEREEIRRREEEEEMRRREHEEEMRKRKEKQEEEEMMRKLEEEERRRKEEEEMRREEELIRKKREEEAEMMRKQEEEERRRREEEEEMRRKQEEEEEDIPVASARVRKGAAPPRPQATVPTFDSSTGERPESPVASNLTHDEQQQLHDRTGDALLANHALGGMDGQLRSASVPEGSTTEVMVTSDAESCLPAPKTPFDDDVDDDNVEDEALNRADVMVTHMALLAYSDSLSPSAAHAGNNGVSGLGHQEGGAGQGLPAGEKQAEPIIGTVPSAGLPAALNPGRQGDGTEREVKREHSVLKQDVTTECQDMLAGSTASVEDGPGPGFGWQGMLKKKNRAPLPPGAPERDCVSQDGDSLVTPTPKPCAKPQSEDQKAKAAGKRRAPQPGGEAESGGLTLPQARVSPSEPQPITMQSCTKGGGVAGKVGGLISALRRTHPVKPLGSLESHQPMNSPGGDLGGTETTTKVTDLMWGGGGPYSQLTHPELTSLVIKQQGELYEKDLKIKELEDYIDNLLVRVIEEKPSILMSLNTAKKAV